jgi:EmrB/QacA subfamily drug resistance transporter
MSQPVAFRPWLFFSMVAVGVFLSTMDSSMVNVALPSMMRGFGTTLAQTEWVALIYLLTITVSLLFWGHLSDHLGKGRMYLLGMLVFSLGSLACYLASTLSLLVFCRFAQASGASMMMSSGPAIIKMAFPARQLGRALGLIGIATSIGLMSGPVVSGYLIHYFSWRAIFLVTAPLSLLCFGLGWRWLLPTAAVAPAVESAAAGVERMMSFDWLGLLSWAALIVFMVLVSTHHEALSGGMLLICFVLFCLLLVFFIMVEQRAVQPILPFVLFQKRYFAIAMICAALSFAVLFEVLILIPFYLDYVRRLPVDRIGLVMMAVPVAVFVVSPLSGWLYDRVGARLLTTAGLAISSLALIFLCFLDEHSSVMAVAWRLTLLGAGQALFLSPNTASVLAIVDSYHVGITSGMLATVRNLGMLAGVALSGLVFGEIFSLLSGGLDVKDFSSEYVDVFIRSLRISFALAAVMAVIGALLSGRRQ